MIVTDLETLERLYAPSPVAAAMIKEVAEITPDYARLIAASPFAILATSGPEGLDCSPRGDRPGFVRVADPRTLMLPDRRGNNRIDSLRNVVRDPRVALLFLIPGSGTTLRVSGRAVVSAEPALRQSFEIEGKAPRTVLVIHVEAAYFQCARAIVRSALWDPSIRIDAQRLPKPGAILAALSSGSVGGAAYDAEWPARAAASLW